MSIKGAFLFMRIVVKRKYPKGWIDYDAQLEKLRGRGLRIDDSEAAKEFLAYSNYYRFTGYCLRFQNVVNPVTNDRVFKMDVAFEDIRDLYLFDRGLRDCIAKALELVEISFRASVAYWFGKKYDAFGHVKEANFVSKFTAKRIDDKGRPGRSSYDEWRDDLIRETQRSNELFVKHFETTYLEFPDLPIWVALEICSFGTLSKMFQNMLKMDMRDVAMCYQLQASDLDTWVHSFVYVRNICAHHARLWDKKLAIAPHLPPGKLWDPLRGKNNSVYCTAMTLNWMLAHDSVSKAAHASWKSELEGLVSAFFERYPLLKGYLGFPDGWTELDVWATV